VKKLLDVLHRLTDLGNSIIIIEHNMDVIRNADWIIDLGPEGGEDGGRLVAQGTPEQVARVKKSYTGQALVSYFGNGKRPGDVGTEYRALSVETRAQDSVQKGKF
jgi:excinuclease ABC subunit A